MIKIGFVSLLLDYKNEPVDFRTLSHIEDKFEYPKRFIEEISKSRLKDVILNIEWAKKNDIRLLLFPGWTLSNPVDLRSVTKYVGKNLHVILELCKGSVEFRNAKNEERKQFRTNSFNDDSGVFILNNHKVINGPIFQLFSEGLSSLKKKWAQGFIKQLKSEFSRECTWDYRDKDDEYVGFAQGRWINLGDNNQFLLILCGETNLTNDKNHEWLEIAKQNGFDQIDYSKAKAILNPAHTPSGKYMDQKRFTWSKLANVPLITCSNIYGQLRKKDGKLKFPAGMDGSKFFTDTNIYKLQNYTSNGKFENIQFENHSIDRYQRGIVTL